MVVPQSVDDAVDFGAWRGPQQVRAPTVPAGGNSLSLVLHLYLASGRSSTSTRTPA